MAAEPAVDVHQHLWPEHLVDRLRARTRTPYLRGWTLHTRGEPPREADPAHHDVRQRVAQDQEDGVALACVSLSSTLGIENLVRPEAASLIAAWHEAARALPGHFRAWASVPMVDPDLDELAALLGDGFAGLQLPATDLASPAAWERAGHVLRVAETAGKPVLVHPGPELVRPLAGRLPTWRRPAVSHPAQLQAAWWGWQAARGRELFPRLRVLFASGAGLAPVHHERQVARGGEPPTIDPGVFVDTSSYGPQGLDALVRVLGVDVLVLGSDRPYVEPARRLSVERSLGDAARHAIATTNPTRLLEGETKQDPRGAEGRTWSRAS